MLMVGVRFDQCKPVMSTFLRPIVDELLNLETEGTNNFHVWSDISGRARYYAGELIHLPSERQDTTTLVKGHVIGGCLDLYTCSGSGSKLNAIQRSIQLYILRAKR